MENVFGNNVKQYRDVIVRYSSIGDNSILADDVFITDSTIGRYCTVERRGMLFNSIIGDYSYTGYNTVVKHAKIGKFCSISWNVSVGGANHDYNKISTHPFSFKEKYGFANTGGEYSSFLKPLSIGNDVWIGCNTVILRNVNIGNGAVIGASSVVTKDVPPYSVVVGNPAKVIKYRFPIEIIEMLIEMKWWDWETDFIKRNIGLFQKNEITISMLKDAAEQYKKYVYGEMTDE